MLVILKKQNNNKKFGTINILLSIYIYILEFMTKNTITFTFYL